MFSAIAGIYIPTNDSPKSMKIPVQMSDTLLALLDAKTYARMRCNQFKPEYRIYIYFNPNATTLNETGTKLIGQPIKGDLFLVDANNKLGVDDFPALLKRAETVTANNEIISEEQLNTKVFSGLLCTPDNKFKSVKFTLPTLKRILKSTHNPSHISCIIDDYYLTIYTKSNITDCKLNPIGSKLAGKVVYGTIIITDDNKEVTAEEILSLNAR